MMTKEEQQELNNKIKNEENLQTIYFGANDVKSELLLQKLFLGVIVNWDLRMDIFTNDGQINVLNDFFLSFFLNALLSLNPTDVTWKNIHDVMMVSANVMKRGFKQILEDNPERKITLQGAK